MFDSIVSCEGELSDTELLAAALGEAPGPVLMEMLLALEFGGSVVSSGTRVQVAAAWERQLAWVSARAVRAMAAAAGPAPAGDRADDWIVQELAAALRLSPGAASGRVRSARELAGRHAETLRAVEAGQICMSRARVLVEELARLDDATAREVEAPLLVRAERLTAGRLRALARRAVHVADPVLAQTERDSAVDGRGVSRTFFGNGTGELRAILPAEDLAVAWEAIENIAADQLPGDPRTADQRRADALTYLVTGGRVPEVELIIHADTAEQAAAYVADLPGCGPLTETAISKLAAGMNVRLHPTTPPPATHGYRPSAPLDRWVRDRDRTCRFPGCPRNARRCDLDSEPYATGGTTAAGNLLSVCRHHHRLKHQTGWNLHLDPDTAATWTSPTGATYTDPPPF
jgi:hypothetical protein